MAFNALALASLLLLSVLCASSASHGGRRLLDASSIQFKPRVLTQQRELVVDIQPLPFGVTGCQVAIAMSCPGNYSTVVAIKLRSGMGVLNFPTNPSFLGFGGSDDLDGTHFIVSFTLNLLAAATEQDVLNQMAGMTVATLSAASGVSISLISFWPICPSSPPLPATTTTTSEPPARRPAVGGGDTSPPPPASSAPPPVTPFDPSMCNSTVASHLQVLYPWAFNNSTTDLSSFKWTFCNVTHCVNFD